MFTLHAPHTTTRLLHTDEPSKPSTRHPVSPVYAATRGSHDSDYNDGGGRGRGCGHGWSGEPGRRPHDPDLSVQQAIRTLIGDRRTPRRKVSTRHRKFHHPEKGLASIFECTAAASGAPAEPHHWSTTPYVGLRRDIRISIHHPTPVVCLGAFAVTTSDVGFIVCNSHS